MEKRQSKNLEKPSPVSYRKATEKRCWTDDSILIRHDIETLDKKDLFVFVFSLILTAVGSVFRIVRVQPAYLGDIVVLVAVLVGGISITVKSVQALFMGNFGVDILASVAIWISALVGEYLAAAIVVIMLNGGELIEDYVSRRTSKAIERLTAFAPMTARVRRSGHDVEVRLEEVEVGDVVLVKPGEKIPLDGVVAKGSGLVNQASITGESVPIEKSVESQVYGNTLLENGTLDIKVTRNHRETVFAHIVKQVEEAQSRKAQVERVADRYARWFAPMILLVAVATQLVTNNPLSTAAVLVISCPCALTLATPIAVVAGLGNSARNGVLIRGGTVLESIGKSDVVIIDKTGTMTLGKPQVVGVKPLGGRRVEDVLVLAGTAERRSEHSLARAILDKVKEQKLALVDPDKFHMKPGYGIVSEYANHRILVGNMRLMKEYGIELDKESTGYVDAESSLGRTVTIVAEDAEASGIISIADTLREGVQDSISQMRRAGARKVVMLTGDNLPTATDVAKQAGIDEVHANLLPEDKAKLVNEYRRQGYHVIVVGDGINDAPALAEADVGIAMGIGGTDVAIETAGIVLMTDDLSKIAKTMKLGQKVLSVINQNVIFALAVNLFGLLLSTQGFVSPVLASIIHESNALIVVFNSARLLSRET